MGPTPSPCGTSPATPRTTSSSSAAQGVERPVLVPSQGEVFSPREVVMGRFQGGPCPTEAFTPPSYQWSISHRTCQTTRKLSSGRWVGKHKLKKVWRICSGCVDARLTNLVIETQHRCVCTFFLASWTVRTQVFQALN